MVSVLLYNVTDDRRKVNKNIDDVITTYSATLDDDVSIMNPTFVLTGLNLSEKFNYLYCSDLGRYYFINEIEFCNGGLYKLHCHVDVLMSFKTDILRHNAYIARQEKKFFKSNQSKNGIFTDMNYPVRADCFIKTIDIGDVADGAEYYLTVNGGVQ